MDESWKMSNSTSRLQEKKVKCYFKKKSLTQRWSSWEGNIQDATGTSTIWLQIIRAGVDKYTKINPPPPCKTKGRIIAVCTYHEGIAMFMFNVTGMIGLQIESSSYVSDLKQNIYLNLQ